MIDLSYIPQDDKFCFGLIILIIAGATALTALCHLFARYYERRTGIADQKAYERELARQAREQRRIEELEFMEQMNEVAAECDYRKAEWIARQWAERFNDEG